MTKHIDQRLVSSPDPIGRAQAIGEGMALCWVKTQPGWTLAALGIDEGESEDGLRGDILMYSAYLDPEDHGTDDWLDEDVRDGHVKDLRVLTPPGDRPVVYLSIPYSGKETASFNTANEIAWWAIKAGCVPYSPITHSHPIATQCASDEENCWEVWGPIDKEMIGRCDELWVIILDGWEESVGVQQEIKWAWGMGKKVRYLDPRSLEFTTDV